MGKWEWAVIAAKGMRPKASPGPGALLFSFRFSGMVLCLFPFPSM